jgi:DNA-directed RNA polymerase subunit M/transcription elongation factor TFIIS
VTWHWYQGRIAEFFRRVPGARVEEDIFVTGRSGTRRQLDVDIYLPMQVQLTPSIRVTVDIHIIADAKCHDRPIAVGKVDQVNGLRDDIGAHLAIIASPFGFTAGASNRAAQLPMHLLRVTSDLLGLLESVEIEWGTRCHSYLCDDGIIMWTPPSMPGATVLGSCQLCDVAHVLCPDCGTVFHIHEYDEERSLKCPGCERIYSLNHNSVGERQIDVVADELDILILRVAYENASKQITRGKVQKIINRTKWQYFTEESPLINLTESEYVEWTENGNHLRITERGIEHYESDILGAGEADE